MKLFIIFMVVIVSLSPHWLFSFMFLTVISIPSCLLLLSDQQIFFRHLGFFKKHIGLKSRVFLWMIWMIVLWVECMCFNTGSLAAQKPCLITCSTKTFQLECLGCCYVYSWSHHQIFKVCLWPASWVTLNQQSTTPSFLLLNTSVDLSYFSTENTFHYHHWYLLGNKFIRHFKI